MSTSPFSFKRTSFELIGILNITPDSFSDGGNFFDPDQALQHGLSLIEQGASILDIGGESSRPGALPISAEEEIARLLPVITKLRSQTDIPLSIDTYKPAVAEAALKAGASIINDITALEDREMAPLIAHHQAGVILMHMQGKPATMQQNPTYPHDDALSSVMTSLGKARQKALEHKIAPNSILLDPGIGFGKTVNHNLSLIRGIPQLRTLGSPLMLGHSRKSLLKHLARGDSSEEQLFSGITLAIRAYQLGVNHFRIHDPSPYLCSLQTLEKIEQIR